LSRDRAGGWVAAARAIQSPPRGGPRPGGQPGGRAV